MRGFDVHRNMTAALVLIKLDKTLASETHFPVYNPLKHCQRGQPMALPNEQFETVASFGDPEHCQKNPESTAKWAV